MTDLSYRSVQEIKQRVLLSCLRKSGLGKNGIDRVKQAYPIEVDGVGNYAWGRPCDPQDLALVAGIPLQIAERAFEEFEKRGY